MGGVCWEKGRGQVLRRGRSLRVRGRAHARDLVCVASDLSEAVSVQRSCWRHVVLQLLRGRGFPEPL